MLPNGSESVCLSSAGFFSVIAPLVFCPPIHSLVFSCTRIWDDILEQLQSLLIVNFFLKPPRNLIWGSNFFGSNYWQQNECLSLCILLCSAVLEPISFFQPRVLMSLHELVVSIAHQPKTHTIGLWEFSNFICFWSSKVGLRPRCVLQPQPFSDILFFCQWRPSYKSFLLTLLIRFSRFTVINPSHNFSL